MTTLARLAYAITHPIAWLDTRACEAQQRAAGGERDE